MVWMAGLAMYICGIRHTCTSQYHDGPVAHSTTGVPAVAMLGTVHMVVGTWRDGD